MNRILVVLLYVMVTMLPQTMIAKWDAYYFHTRDNNPLITMDSSPEEIFNVIMETDKLWDYTMPEYYQMVLQKSETDAFGNVHMTYNQMNQEAYSDYQIILHFHPDGSLYYRNGTILIEEKGTQETNSLRGGMITAERAAVIATGNPASETVVTIEQYRKKLHKAYRVKNNKTMSYVFVDAYSGEVLFSRPLFYSYAPWNEVTGTTVALSTNTTHYGTQLFNTMLTDKGYILRDPLRNIITIDALNDTKAYVDDIPADQYKQLQLITKICGDAVATDEEVLTNPKTTSIIKGFSIYLEPGMRVMQKDANIHLYYIDKDDKPMNDIINMDLSDAAWTNDGEGYWEISHSMEHPLAMELVDTDNMLDFTIDGKVYSMKNAVKAGEAEFIRFTTDENVVAPLYISMDYDVNATKPAVDVHWSIAKVYDMYAEYFNIQSCDDKGGQIVNLVNPSRAFSIAEYLPYNSFACPPATEDCHGVPTFFMVYGMGVPGQLKPLTSFDINAHEYTHLVTAGCGNNLCYQNESGALNEALADCMAMVAEYYAFGSPSWLIGENVSLNADNLRSFIDPWYSGAINGVINDKNALPKYYGGRYWIDYEHNDYDNGGVHANSNVFNHLFYLLCEGAEDLTNEMGETNDIAPVGMDKMKDIVFHSMRYYNSGYCDYAEIADNLMVVIEDIYDNDSETIADLQYKMIVAYNHVGMSSTLSPTGIVLHTTDNKVAAPSLTFNLYGIPVSNDYKGVAIRDKKKVVLK